MASTVHNEQTPLLSAKRAPTPLPWFQLMVLFFLQIAEPLTSSIIYPFAPQLVRDLGITHGDEKKVGYYVGILESSFFAAQAVTIIKWSRLSDKIGRKPVLIAGLLATSFSMWSFGFSTTYSALVISRCINGAVSGNIGVMKSMIAELTDSTNVVEAFAYLPIVWATGATVGPIIGGVLARPTQQYPNIFGNFQLFKDYPYLLPCSVSAIFAFFATFVAWAALKETVPEPVPVKKILIRRLEKLTGNIPLLGKTAKNLEDPIFDTMSVKQRSFRSLLTSRVLISTLNYSMIALIDIAYRALMPIFFATPTSLGGLGFSPAVIGMCLSVYGIVNGLFQIFCFAPIHRRFGGKRVLVWSLALAFPTFAFFPLMSEWVKHYGYVTTAVWVMIALQLLFYLIFDLAFACIFIYIAAAAPDEHSIGATNGVAQMAVAIVRAFGPSFSTSLYSLSMERNYMGGWLVWWAMMGLATGGVVAARLVPKEVWKRPGEQ